MAGTEEMLRTSLGNGRYSMLLEVMSQEEPRSGRALAAAMGVSPTTASARLSQLEEAGLVRSSRAGRSKLWGANVDNDVIRSWLREQRETTAEAGSSPVSTGGGGVTLERKIAADYLGRLLLGHTASGLGESRRVTSVAFQQAPKFTVDDLVIEAAEEGETEPSLVLAVGARRTPNLVQSDEKSRALFRAFVQQLLIVPATGPELRLGLAVAGAQEQVGQLQTLVGLATDQSGANGFFSLVRTPGKLNQRVHDRLKHVEGLVRQALVDLGLSAPSPGVVEVRVWELLSRLVVLQPRLEPPDDSDWAALANSLMPVARGTDLYGATQLRDRLLTLADDWAPTAAAVNLSMLRRAAHDLLDSTVRRDRKGWQALELLDEQARAAVGNEIVSADGVRRVQVDRGEAAADLSAALSSAGVVVLHGESGVGKSAVALSLRGMRNSTESSESDVLAETACTDAAQVVCVNLRQMPSTAVAFEAVLGGSRLRDLLAELSANRRVLVIDGADAVAEGAQDLLTYMVSAAVIADVQAVAVTASEVKQLVSDAISARIGKAPMEVVVPPLTDDQISLIVGEFSELEAMAANPRSRELLRRPVVVDLLVRGGVRGVPVSDIDAMQQVWEGLVRRKGSSERGTSTARDLVMLQLARQSLQTSRDQLDTAAALDPVAVEGLRTDGLLRSSHNPFRPVPEFAHDEVRRYAVARLMVAASDPTQVLLEAGVPRWALGAARLACQALFTMTGSDAAPTTGRFMRWQGKFNKLVEDGHGARWADVPGEALLTLGDARPVLRDAWAQLQQDGRAGVQQLIRLADQRLRGASALVRISAVEPLVELVLESETPWRSSDGEQTLLLEWLHSLTYSNAPAGHTLRLELRARLLKFCVAADERFQEDERRRAAALTARNDATKAAEKALAKRMPLLGPIGYSGSRRRRPRPAMSGEITNKTMVELLALLGPDLGLDGEGILRRIAEADPPSLAPAMEGAFCGRSLAGYRRGFLAEMVLAYYLDEEEDGKQGFGHEDGVRDHEWIGFSGPLSAWYRGPFMALFQFDFDNGIATLNQILNHAAAVRARTLTRLDKHDSSPAEVGLDRYSTMLHISGAPHAYVGDSSVWNWYRGTGTGPYPCMSALQALERVCDQFIKFNIPLDRIISIFLRNCDNVAIIAFAVGLLVRHVEKAETLLDPFLEEADVWHFELSRVVVEYGGLRASSEGVTGSERRGWSLREAATSLVMSADPKRAEALRLVGLRLIDNTHRRLEDLGESVSPEAAAMELNTVRAWASSLDRSTYTMQKTAEGYLVKSNPPEDVAAALSIGMGEFLRSQEDSRLSVRYHVRQENGTAETISVDELISDLNSAASLVETNPGPDIMGWDAPAAVASYALRQNLLHGQSLPAASAGTAADILLRIGEGEVPQRDGSIEESYFSSGADRSAARAMPLLLMPNATQVRQTLDASGKVAASTRIDAAVTNLARTIVLQTRLFLARGLDPLWSLPCSHDDSCLHRTALDVGVEMMRDSVLAPWDIETQERTVERLDDPVVDSLREAATENIYVSRLDAAIRAFGPAAAADICVSADARALLDALLDAQRRALIADHYDADVRGSHSLVAARALLTVGEHAAILSYVGEYIDHSVVLDHALRALSAAAEEDPQRAAIAHRVWPAVMDRVMDAHDAGHRAFADERNDRDYALAALLPNPTGEFVYLHPELGKTPIVWWDPRAWQTTIERWIDFVGGKPKCVDSLVRFLSASLPHTDQAALGLLWVARAVLAAPEAVAGHCYHLTDWLVGIRSAAEDAGLSGDWQRAVDALVVGGETRLAAYSE